MGNQAMAIDLEFVLLGFSAEDGMIFENQARFAGPGEALEEKRRGDAADSAAHDDAVVDFSGVDGFRTVGRVAHLVTGGEHFEGVAVGGGVIADAAIAGPFIIGGEQLRRSQGLQEKGAGSEQSRAEKVAAGDRCVHSQCMVDVFRNRQGRSRTSSLSLAKTYGRVSGGCLLFS